MYVDHYERTMIWLHNFGLSFFSQESGQLQNISTCVFSQGNVYDTTESTPTLSLTTSVSELPEFVEHQSVKVQDVSSIFRHETCHLNMCFLFSHRGSFMHPTSRRPHCPWLPQFQSYWNLQNKNQLRYEMFVQLVVMNSSWNNFNFRTKPIISATPKNLYTHLFGSFVTFAKYPSTKFQNRLILLPIAMQYTSQDTSCTYAHTL